MYALDAYVFAYNMSRNGDVECYMTPNGVRAFKPIFTVIDGIVTLSAVILDAISVAKGV